MTDYTGEGFEDNMLGEHDASAPAQEPLAPDVFFAEHGTGVIGGAPYTQTALGENAMGTVNEYLIGTCLTYVPLPPSPPPFIPPLPSDL